MNIADAQREMRESYVNAAPGQAISAAFWLASACCGTWLSVRSAVLALIFGGALLFPLTVLLCRAVRPRASVSASNPLRPLAPFVALAGPAILPLAAITLLYRPAWFYPSIMVIMGAHYVPFAFLYGRRAFLVLGALLVTAGFALACVSGVPFTLGAWLGAAMLAVFAVLSLPRPISS
ncbi:MAG TPA: hypothetical protein VN650_04500 [Gemmatimonadaceae bacterium]|nr:hypothetical protein [Gemmatimonadaceae bacterium]